ncbi:unnamed protein product [Polarella glacialis]|uniref:Cellulase n=1 Tax=Polarella glacialis TaxID=89957 RepID=A0A813EED1_POLGL|nr:unnamed protein product [Polarella glacialis]
MRLRLAALPTFELYFLKLFVCDAWSMGDASTSGVWLDLMTPSTSKDVTPRPVTHYWDCCLPSWSNWYSAEAGGKLLSKGITPIPACSATNFSQPLWSASLDSASCPLDVFNCSSVSISTSTTCSADSDCWQAVEHMKCYGSLCEDGATACDCADGTRCGSCPATGACTNGFCAATCCGDNLFDDQCCGPTEQTGVPSCLAMSVPYSTRGATRPMCVKMGTSSSSCKAGDSDPNLGANCAGSASGSSQLPFAEEPTTDIDSGLRVFAATQQTSGSGWIGSGCQCYELELFSAQDYDPKVATNLNQSGYSDETSFCAENGTGCLLWPSGKTLTVMVSNEGGMGTDTQPFTAEVRTALFDFAVPGGGFGDFNGCSGAWPGVYVKNGGPCSASDDTENCNIFGGFKYAGSDLAAGGGACLLRGHRVGLSGGCGGMQMDVWGFRQLFLEPLACCQ